MRIGSGYDVHRFSDKAATTIMIGGVEVPHSVEIIAHSDGDVVLHALCDALLGALALGDIGHHFPDTDPAYAGADSRSLLTATYEKVLAMGFQLVNADITLIAEAPRVANYIQQMRDAIASDLNVAVGNISVKATTTEKLGFIGKKEGLAAQAVVLLDEAG